MIKKHITPPCINISNISIEMDKIIELIRHQSANENSNDIYVDFSTTQVIDSSGLAMLIELTKTAKALGKKITYTNLNYNILELCKLYKICGLINISDSK